MRWRRRRLAARDRLNIQVALSVQIGWCISHIRNAPDQDAVSAWAREAASYITTSHRIAARGRDRGGVADQSSRWASDLCAAVTEAVARAGQP